MCYVRLRLRRRLQDEFHDVDDRIVYLPRRTYSISYSVFRRLIALTVADFLFTSTARACLLLQLGSGCLPISPWGC